MPAALDLATTDPGADSVRLLIVVAGQRELGTAKNPAAVLRYRLDPTPSPGDVLAANYPLAVADAQPRRTTPSDQHSRSGPDRTRNRTRGR